MKSIKIMLYLILICLTSCNRQVKKTAIIKYKETESASFRSKKYAEIDLISMDGKKELVPSDAIKGYFEIFYHKNQKIKLLAKAPKEGKEYPFEIWKEVEFKKIKGKIYGFHKKKDEFYGPHCVNVIFTNRNVCIKLFYISDPYSESFDNNYALEMEIINDNHSMLYKFDISSEKMMLKPDEIAEDFAGCIKKFKMTLVSECWYTQTKTHLIYKTEEKVPIFKITTDSTFLDGYSTNFILYNALYH